MAIESRRPRGARVLAALCLAAVALAGAVHGSADEGEGLDIDTRACVAAFGEAQRLRREGALGHSRDQLLVCAQVTCPAVIVAKCVPWLAEIERAIPTLVVSAKGPDGHDSVEVRVLVDGDVVAERLDGLPLALDPGPRRLRFEHRAAPPVELELLITQGEKERRVEVRFPAPASARPAPVSARPTPTRSPRAPQRPSAGRSPLVWLGVGTAGGGLLLGTITGALALTSRRELEQACGGLVCTEEHRDEYNRGLALAHVSTVGFVVGGAGTALAVAGLALGGGAKPESATAFVALRPGALAATVRFTAP